jgi:hypothetical protein
MVRRKVTQQLHEQLDVDQVVQQVLVLQLVGLNVSNGLLVSARALAVPWNYGVLDHLALLANEVLDLVLD